MWERKGFTLVELLVVIAIIALLIAILAPSLKAAKDLAKAAYCKTTLNALNKSAMIYAEMNKGYMMVFNHDVYPGSDGVEYTQAAKQPDRTATAFSAGPRNAATGLLENAVQYGMVYAAGILGPAEMFYCPAPIKDERHMLSNYPRPWGSQTGSGSNIIRCGYMWNPWVKAVPGVTDPNQKTYDDALLVERHPNERFLTTDLILSNDHIGHRTSSSAKWNHGYVDGHVDDRDYPKIYNLFIGGYDPRIDWVLWQRDIRPKLLEQ
ncbi:MAG: prepilin-type N-terminal cleavage/methylation domain-containing protein [Phycisphaerae bacterium]|nr:prepilin-type N-terminal cleavage/methylation domain-containing protein [Phycisphaerae bacterium]